MGNPRAFLSVPRQGEPHRPLAERVRDSQEVTLPMAPDDVARQASRCMDCGIPFCHQGCPLGNLIPEWNDLVYRGLPEEAARRLLETNNFPEITGRVCPAPCEASCVLGLSDDAAPVTIKAVERSIADSLRVGGAYRPFEVPPSSGRSMAIVGSGPAGLAAAQELARLGHAVTVFERDTRVGGLLRYGIPDFKLEKTLLDERLAQLVAEGVTFRAGIAVGSELTGHDLLRGFDAVVLACGAGQPRPLDLPGRSLDGVHYAMEFLAQQNRRVAGELRLAEPPILATDKDVVVIGGGDTGSDCVGTSLRQGAKSVLQLELMPRPPASRAETNPWPEWPLILRSSTSHEEGAVRDWAVSTRAFTGHEGRVHALDLARVEWKGRAVTDLPDGAFRVPCDLVLLALGFVGPEEGGIHAQLGVRMNERGAVETTATGATTVPRVFAAGDVARGQSLVVWAIADGRRVARGVDAALREGARTSRAG
jgi:glutamate synthase (NADPH/NADH) small chain